MTRWEYKSVRLERAGTKEDFGFTWTYTPWELMTDKSGKQALDPALKELGSEGWELVSTHILWEAMSDGTSRNEGSMWGVFKRRHPLSDPPSP